MFPPVLLRARRFPLSCALADRCMPNRRLCEHQLLSRRQRPIKRRMLASPPIAGFAAEGTAVAGTAPSYMEVIGESSGLCLRGAWARPGHLPQRHALEP